MIKKKNFIPPTVYDIYIRGEEEKLNGVRKVVNELARYGGVDDLCPDKLYIPLKFMMKLLVGSDNHSGYVISMNTDDSECVILQTETEEPHALCNALKECFSDINTEIKSSIA